MAGLLGYATEQDEETFSLTDEERMALELLAAELASTNAQTRTPNALEQIAPQLRLGHGGLKDLTVSGNIPYLPEGFQARLFARPGGMNPAFGFRGRMEF